MNIRSITYFFNPEWPLNEDKLEAAGEFLKAAQPAFEQAGYTVQTARLATTPFPHILPELSVDALKEFALGLEEAAAAQGFNYIALGPALIKQPDSYGLIPEVLKHTENTFFSAEMGTAKDGVSLPAVRACAEIIEKLGPIDPNGFANLYFTALANVEPGAPFFPAAYHAGEQAGFALATESAEVAVKAFANASSLNEAIENLVSAIEKHANELSVVGEKLAEEFDTPFGGVDFSLAAYPEEARSLGTSFEQLGIPKIGQHGSLAAAALIANAIDAADFKRVGFSGLMLPVLEDATLARGAAEGTLTVKDMLMYSAVCGTGLDTIPLPGDTSAAQINAVLLDLAALAQRLEKPLTARLMPIPGKEAGKMTTFDFDFFANSRVMALEAETLTGPLAGDESFKLKARHNHR